MADNSEIGKFKVRGRLSFEHLFVASASVKDGPKKYRTNVLIDPSTKEGKKDIALIENAMDEVKEEIWPGKNPKFKADRVFFMDGEDMVDADGEIRDGYDGMKFIKLSNDKRPKLRDRDGQTDLTQDDDKIYSGANVIVYGRVYGIKDPDKGGNGLFASVDAVQFVKHGEKFGGGGISDDEIENLGDDEDDGDERPAKRKPSRDDDDDRPARKKRTIDDEDDDERPVRRRPSEDEDERPARRKPARDEDDDERPRKRRPSDDDDVT